MTVQITDRSGEVLTVTEAALQDGTDLKVLRGDTYHVVSLFEVDSIAILAGKSRFFRDKLYYPAKIRFVGEEKKENAETDSVSQFVCIESKLIGQSKFGQVEIGLDALQTVKKQ